MTPLFSIVMTVFETFPLLPRAMNCVARQSCGEWELLVVADGAVPAGAFSPRRLVQQMQRRCPGKRIEFRQEPRAEGCYGNVARHRALELARGEYVCWVNHDNLIASDYLEAHRENIHAEPGCLSVVDIDLWKQDRYHGVYPRRFAASNIDLLNFAVPLETARQVQAFGPAMQQIYAADWHTFAACRKRLTIRHNRRIVGTHF